MAARDNGLAKTRSNQMIKNNSFMFSKIFSRRKFLKNLACAGAAFAFAPLLVNGVLAAESKAPQKNLVVYYSETGHTRDVANAIHKLVGGDIIKIETVKPYPADYDMLTKVAKEEQSNNARPQIKTKVPNIDEYGVIFLGYPNWWSSMPMPVYTFVEQNCLDGKTIAPFATHGGGGLGHSVEDLKKIAPGATILKPLAVRSSHSSSAGEDVKKWIEGLGTALIETTTGNPGIYPDGAY